MAQLAGQDAHEALKSATGRTTSSRAAGYFRNGLVVTELALALVLLIGNGLMLRAFWKLLAVQSGIDPSNVLTMRVTLPNTTYPDGKSAVRFWSDLEQRVRSLPGVTSVAVVSGLPPDRPINANDTKIEGFVPKQGGPLQNIDYYQVVGHDYFNTLRVKLMDGRLFDDRDGVSSNPVIVINKTMAQIYWPDSTAIGRRVQPGFQGPWYTVIGVVDDVKNGGLDKPAGTEIYFSVRQLGDGFVPRGGTLLVKSQGDSMALAGAVRGQVRALDASVPVSALRSMDDVMQSAQARPRFLTLLMSLFSGVALTLAALGIFGVISFSVARRTNEFGVRMALGAQPHRVLMQVLKQGLILAAAGMAIGIAGAAFLSRYLKELLFGVSAMDPTTFGLMAVVLLGVTAAACLIPARRATQVDPLVALRYE
jgi:predicted permease